MNFVKKYFWLGLSIIFSLVLLLLWFSFFQEDQLSFFFSSDTLYLPSIYRDIFEDGYSLNGWTLNAAPNFIPDMLLFFILRLISPNFIVAAFLFSIVQYFTIVYLFYIILKKVRESITPNIIAISIFLFTLFLFIFLIDKNFIISSLINNNSFHNGAFIMALINIFLVFKYLKKESKKVLIAIFIITAISTPCDRLVLIHYAIPMLFSFIFLYIIKYERKKLIKLAFVLIGGVILGLMILMIFKNNSLFELTKPYGSATIENIYSSWDIFCNQMYAFTTNFSIIQFLTFTCLTSYIWCIYYVISELVKILRKKETFSLLFIFEVFVFFFTPIVILSPIIAGSYGGIDTFRYNYFPFILLPFNIVLLISSLLERKEVIMIIINGVFVTAIAFFIVLHINSHNVVDGLKKYFTYCAPMALTVDSVFENETDTPIGVCNDYWDAKQIMMFSKRNIRIHYIFDSGYPWLHVANRHWFFDSGKGKYPHPEFTFLLWKSTDELPEFFINTNPPYEKIELGDWILYKVKPFRFDPQTFAPILI